MAHPIVFSPKTKVPATQLHQATQSSRLTRFAGRLYTN